jgi:hypothetical protein
MSLPPRRARVALSLLALAAPLAACDPARSDAALAARDSVRLTQLPVRLASLPAPPSDAVRDSMRAARVAAARSRAPHLSPLADSIARSLVLMVGGRDAFTAAVRAGHLFVDIGRVDVPLKTAERLTAFREAVAALSPIRIGEPMRLRGPWGSEVATVAGYETWNGRVVLSLRLTPSLDSLVRHRDPLVALAVRGDTLPATADSCRRDSLSPGLTARVKGAADSAEVALRADTSSLPERLRPAVRVQRTRATGCFGAARALVVVTAQAGAYEWVRQSVFLVDAAGAVTPLRVRDPNFAAHEVLHALDADGDGVDDVATRSRRERGGGTTILRLNLAEKMLVRMTSGFVWES